MQMCRPWHTRAERIPHITQSCCPSGRVMLSSDIHSQIAFLQTTQPQIVCSRSWHSLASFLVFFPPNKKKCEIGNSWDSRNRYVTGRNHQHVIVNYRASHTYITRHQTNRPNNLLTLKSIILHPHLF